MPNHLEKQIQIIDPKLLQVKNWWLFIQEGFYVRMEKRVESILS